MSVREFLLLSKNVNDVHVLAKLVTFLHGECLKFFSRQLSFEPHYMCTIIQLSIGVQTIGIVVELPCHTTNNENKLEYSGQCTCN